MKSHITKRKAIRMIACVFLIALAVLLYMQICYELGNFHFGSMIEGRITVLTDEGNAVYEFNDPDGGYGWYDWAVGPEDAPIEVYLFNKNDWQITRMDFTVMQSGDEWLITGDISSNRFQRSKYEERVPADERIKIDVRFN